MRNIYFTPGPSGLYFTIDHHLKEAVKNGILSISHRSKRFEALYQEAETHISELLNLPSNYKMVFTNSATEIWDKLADSVISEKSLHYVNGAFSRKFYSTVQNHKKETTLIESDWGLLPDFNSAENEGYDLIAVAHNETSTGVKTPVSQINELRTVHKNAIIAVDAVSSLPVVALDYSKVDTVYASVQKAFGLPAGLGLWLINDATEVKARANQEAGKFSLTNHNILALLDQGKNYQTPSTPNVLGIYLLSMVANDMIHRGIQQIRSDSIYKSAIMYNMLDQHDSLTPFVSDKSLRSDTIIVIDSFERTDDLIGYLARHKMQVGTGYGKMKGRQVRIANFPTHSREQFEMLVDLIDKFE